MKLEINITKKRFWMLATIITVFIVGIFVYAAVDESKGWHPVDQVEGLEEQLTGLEISCDWDGWLYKACHFYEQQIHYIPPNGEQSETQCREANWDSGGNENHNFLNAKCENGKVVSLDIYELRNVNGALLRTD